MRVSTKGRYALRLMIELAKQPHTYISLREISEKQQISQKYLEQIIMLLTRAKLVRSIRGPQGGYTLAMDAQLITAGMILRVTEGSLAPVACVEQGCEACVRSGNCETRSLWKRLHESIDEIVDSVTLQDLLHETHEAQPGMWL